MRLHLTALAGLILGVASLSIAQPPRVGGTMAEDLKAFTETPAPPGYEGQLAAMIHSRIEAYSPQTDRLGDIWVTLGSGAPHRLVAAPMDEPGYVVSRITPDGYLQLQRLPQAGLLPLFNELYSAEPVRIETTPGRWIPGIVAGLSVHLMPGRTNPPDPDDIANMYVDIGARTAAEARAAGADVLSPLAIDRTVYEMGSGKWTAAAIGDRFGDAALIELLRRLDPEKLHGTLTVAFLAQQWTGARGLERRLESEKPDELIYVGRMLPGESFTGRHPEMRFPQRQPGSGVLIASESGSAPSAIAADLERAGAAAGVPVASDFSAPLIPRSYLAPPPMPTRFAHLGIAVSWPSTPAETLDTADLSDLAALLEQYYQKRCEKASFPEARAISAPPLPSRPQTAPSPEAVLRTLTETYGVSEHEIAVREAIKRLLPPWAKTDTDAAGNLILSWAPAGPKRAGILFDAHMDEIGYKVVSVLPDGRLEVTSQGGGLRYYFLGHPAFVHTASGIRAGVMELPQGWTERGFKGLTSLRRSSAAAPTRYLVDVGASNAAEVSALGITSGDYVTVPKKYRELGADRVSARSLDDRVGDTALVAAAWALGPGARNVTFVWSTGEELGLVGAAALAKRLAGEGRSPAYVFAIDTFVSSDSPLESPRFADALLGRGFVVRAIDNSNIVPRKLVEKVLRIARDSGIPAQYGVTGGGNDGSAFLRYGSADVALGWPLRYSHSPGEVIDTRDLDALARIVAAISRSW